MVMTWRIKNRVTECQGHENGNLMLVEGPGDLSRGLVLLEGQQGRFATEGINAL